MFKEQTLSIFSHVLITRVNFHNRLENLKRGNTFYSRSVFVIFIEMFFIAQQPFKYKMLTSNHLIRPKGNYRKVYLAVWSTYPATCEDSACSLVAH